MPLKDIYQILKLPFCVIFWILFPTTCVNLVNSFDESVPERCN